MIVAVMVGVACWLVLSIPSALLTGAL